MNFWDRIKNMLNGLFGTSTTVVGKDFPTYQYAEGPFGRTGASPTPTDYQRPTPTSTPMPTPTPSPADQYNANAPQSVMDIISQVWGDNTQDPLSVLSHPMGMTALPGEQQQGINTGPNRGENPEFKTVLDVPNPDGSIDRGLYRINSNTFDDFLKRKKSLLNQNGIHSWEDMNDPYKNAVMAKIIQQEQGWKGWYAAPANLRGGE